MNFWILRLHNREHLRFQDMCGKLKSLHDDVRWWDPKYKQFQKSIIIEYRLNRLIDKTLDLENFEQVNTNSSISFKK
jgi:hypothetical protein